MEKIETSQNFIKMEHDVLKFENGRVKYDNSLKDNFFVKEE